MSCVERRRERAGDVGANANDKAHFERSAELAEIFDVIAAMTDCAQHRVTKSLFLCKHKHTQQRQRTARLAKQTMMAGLVNVQEV